MSLSKETIKDNWTAFQHFINQGKVLKRSWDYEDNKYSDWYKPDAPFENESIYKSQYIIDDELVEFRKALAEGKTIQYNPNLNTIFRNWDNITGTHNSLLNGSVENYRFIIEPKYEIGDYIRYMGSKRVGKILSFENFKNNIVYKVDFDCDGEKWQNWSQLFVCKWRPEVNEWIWILSDKNNWVLGKFIRELKEQNKIEFLTLNNNVAKTLYKDIIPFKGELPVKRDLK